jgi:hypothetical protein
LIVLLVQGSGLLIQSSTRSTFKKERKKNMLSPTVEEALETPVQEQETPATTITRPAANKSKPKPVKPKPVTDGPVYLLLSANGKYKELSESELQTEAASVVKDPTLRLVKGQFLVPQISFNLTGE